MKRLFKRSGGQVLVDALKVHGVDRAFCVAGESYLDVLNAFYETPEIDLITCRQEGGAAFMAETHGKITGKPGICFVTRGPGACNAAIGVHTAMQDSTPLILFVGQVARDQTEREAFQEIDYRKMFAPPMTKWAAEITSTERIPEMVMRAFQVATSGRPGPVVLALPEDMLREKINVIDTAPYRAISSSPSNAELSQIKEILETAAKPLAIIGGSGWTDQACRNFEVFAKECNLPVAASFRRQDAFNHRSDNYVGELGTGSNPELLDKVRQADVLFVLGARMGEIATQGYQIIKPPVPSQKIIHVHPSAEELGKVFQADCLVQAGTDAFCRVMANTSPPDRRAGQNWLKELREDYLAWTEIQSRDKFVLDVDGVIADLRVKLPEDAIITTDAGNFSGWAQRYIRYGRPGRLLAPTSGAMGYGVPSAIAASLAYPDRMVIGMMGDGGFMMSGQELATAIHTKAKPIFMLFNNNMYGTIRMHQEMNYPGRVSATKLTNPDFTALAQSYGLLALKVKKTEDFSDAFETASNSGQASLIEICMDPEQITTRTKLSDLK